MNLLRLYLIYYSKRIAFTFFLISIVFFFFIFNRSQIHFLPILNPFYDDLSQLQPWLYFVHVIILIFVILIAFEFLFSILYCLNGTLRRTSVNASQDKITTELFTYLSSTDNVRSYLQFIDKLKNLLISDGAKRIYVTQLRKIIMLTRGEVHERCLQLVDVLKNDSLFKTSIRSPYLKHKLFALSAIGDFKLTDYKKDVSKYLNSKNNTLRSESIITYIKINPDTDLTFLAGKNTKFNLWDFNSIVSLVDDYKCINYRDLIFSSSNFVRALGLRLIQRHKVIELKQYVCELLDHPNPLVSEEALLAFLSLAEKDEDVEMLIERFEHTPSQLQEKMLNVIAGFNNKKRLVQFLDSVIEGNQMNLRLLAMEKLFDIDMSLIVKYRTHQNELVRNTYDQLTNITF